MEVVPVFLEVLDTHLTDLTKEECIQLWTRVYDRLNHGMRKYGRVFVTHEGRNSLQEAWEEACDGAQYLTKAYCEGMLTDATLLHDQVRLMVKLEKLLQQQAEDGITYMGDAKEYWEDRVIEQQEKEVIEGGIYE